MIPTLPIRWDSIWTYFLSYQISSFLMCFLDNLFAHHIWLQEVFSDFLLILTQWVFILLLGTFTFLFQGSDLGELYCCGSLSSFDSSCSEKRAMKVPGLWWEWFFEEEKGHFQTYSTSLFCWEMEDLAARVKKVSTHQKIIFRNDRWFLTIWSTRGQWVIHWAAWFWCWFWGILTNARENLLLDLPFSVSVLSEDWVRLDNCYKCFRRFSLAEWDSWQHVWNSEVHGWFICLCFFHAESARVWHWYPWYLFLQMIL